MWFLFLFHFHFHFHISRNIYMMTWHNQGVMAMVAKAMDHHEILLVSGCFFFVHLADEVEWKWVHSMMFLVAFVRIFSWSFTFSTFITLISINIYVLLFWACLSLLPTTFSWIRYDDVHIHDYILLQTVFIHRSISWTGWRFSFFFSFSLLQLRQNFIMLVPFRSLWFLGGWKNLDECDCLVELMWYLAHWWWGA